MFSVYMRLREKIYALRMLVFNYRRVQEIELESRACPHTGYPVVYGEIIVLQL